MNAVATKPLQLGAGWRTGRSVEDEVTSINPADGRVARAHLTDHPRRQRLH